MKIEQIKTSELVPYANNAKLHSDEQIKKIASSIKEFGFNNPVLVDKDNGIIAGHGRVLAAELLKLKEVPCIRLGHLTEAQKKAYILADNRLGDIGGGWNEELLKIELEGLKELDFNIDLTGFDVGEILKIDISKDDDFASRAPRDGDVLDKFKGMDIKDVIKACSRKIVMFSGGKDSMATVAWLKEAGFNLADFELAWCATPLDYPDLDGFIHAFAHENNLKLHKITGKHYDNVVDVIKEFGLPNRITPWCTNAWKIQPLNAWLKSEGLQNTDNAVLIQGWRAEESERRAQAKEIVTDIQKGVTTIRPILGWTTADVFNAIKRQGWSLHPSYDYSPRLGCYWCYATSTEEFSEMKKREPELWERCLTLIHHASQSEKQNKDQLLGYFRRITECLKNKCI